ncbi:MAG: transposase [Desulfovibrio sp.]|nr:transposase [Desulfovibrio sp.]
MYEVTERNSKNGRMLLAPEYTIFSVWTNLEEVSCADVLRLYRDRGTCGQYFAEIKSELDLERLPSGKFCVNELFFQLGMFVNNMLRVMGQSLLCPEIMKMKKVTRRRLRTVMQNLMYMCGRVVRHAHHVILRMKGANGTAGAMCRLYQRLATT